MVLAWENLQEAFVILVVVVVFDFTGGFSFHCFSTSSTTLDQLKCFCGMVDRRRPFSHISIIIIIIVIIIIITLFSVDFHIAITI